MIQKSVRKEEAIFLLPFRRYQKSVKGLNRSPSHGTESMIATSI